MDESYKEVYFNNYCKKCRHEKCEDFKEPCHSCLNEPVNLYSHKPTKYEKKVGKNE